MNKCVSTGSEVQSRSKSAPPPAVDKLENHKDATPTAPAQESLPHPRAALVLKRLAQRLPNGFDMRVDRTMSLIPTHSDLVTEHIEYRFINDP
jgi:hypothetical protein